MYSIVMTKRCVQCWTIKMSHACTNSFCWPSYNSILSLWDLMNSTVEPQLFIKRVICHRIVLIVRWECLLCYHRRLEAVIEKLILSITFYVTCKWTGITNISSANFEAMIGEKMLFNYKIGRHVKRNIERTLVQRWTYDVHYQNVGSFIAAPC